MLHFACIKGWALYTQVPAFYAFEFCLCNMLRRYSKRRWYACWGSFVTTNLPRCACKRVLSDATNHKKAKDGRLVVRYEPQHAYHLHCAGIQKANGMHVGVPSSPPTYRDAHVKWFYQTLPTTRKQRTVGWW